MPNDATLLFSFLPQFPSDSATLTSPLPAMIYMTFDGAAR